MSGEKKIPCNGCPYETNNACKVGIDVVKFLNELTVLYELQEKFKSNPLKEQFTFTEISRVKTRISGIIGKNKEGNCFRKFLE
jgi:hypothetical protein